MSNLSKNHVLFYSERCSHSGEFNNLLSQTQYKDVFVRINVDYNKNLPKSIRSVPTIIVPTHREPLSGNAAFMWINSAIQRSQGQNAVGSGPVPQRSNSQQHRENTNKDDDDVSPFFASEMSGNFSDGFSFLDNNNPISHQFSFLGENEITQETVAKQNNSTGNSRIDARMESMDNDYERLIQQRNNDIGQSIERH
tara:strand:+ start:8983 stop:9570 length:588 start_codon:yes stop_codon:yes gene_type:complete